LTKEHSLDFSYVLRRANDTIRLPPISSNPRLICGGEIIHF
jgi:hypothetical protein